MKKLLFLIFFFFLINVSFSQFKDTLKVPKNIYNSPTEENMENALFKNWCDTLKTDTVLLRIGNYKSYYFLEDSTIFTMTLDSVIGVGNNRISWVHATWNNGLPLKWKFPYRTVNIDLAGYKPTNFIAQWNKSPDTTDRYQLQFCTDSAFTQIYRYDTLPYSSPLSYCHNLIWGNTYWGRVRYLHLDGSFSQWIAIILAKWTPVSYVSIILPKNQLRIETLKIVNDGARTQVMFRFTYYETPKFKYLK